MQLGRGKGRASRCDAGRREMHSTDTISHSNRNTDTIPRPNCNADSIPTTNCNADPDAGSRRTRTASHLPQNRHASTTRQSD